MAAGLVFILFFAFSIALFAFGAAIWAPETPLGARLRGLMAPPKPAQQAGFGERLERILEPVNKAFPKSPDELSELRLLLVQAGYREVRHLYIFRAMRLLIAALLLGAAIIFGAARGSLLLILVLPALGYMLPQFVLKRRITHRQERIRLALPDALDLAIICVEAGLSLDQALHRVGLELRTAHPDFSDELTLLTLEIRAGKPRAEALRNLAKRTGVDDVRSFVTVLIQTDRFGTSIATALRVHSDALRTERRQRAEERAAKTSIKMIPVLVFFIFPVMFFVILGPIIIGFLRNVAPTLHQ
jgi:tight adherence protein C